jgi:predicted RNA-binding Zn-ribbon protein involved in translation (DUF1610 family)
MDHPLEEILQAMDQQILLGNIVYFKFTCAHCGARQTSADANTYHVDGYNCEECGKLTVPTEGNFLLIKTQDPKVKELLLKKLE